MYYIVSHILRVTITVLIITLRMEYATQIYLHSAFPLLHSMGYDKLC